MVNSLGYIFIALVGRAQVFSPYKLCLLYFHLVLGYGLANGPGTDDMNLYELADVMAERYGLDPAIFRRQIMTESTFNPGAVSPDGALGLGQVMPETAADPGYGVTPLASDSMTDPEENLRFSAEYMRAMLDKFDGNYELALSAYNAGPGAVDEVGGVPQNEETLGYLSKIMPDRGGRRTPETKAPTEVATGRPDTVGGIEAALKTLAESDGGSEADDYESAMAGLSMLTKAFSPRKVSPLKATSSVSRGSGGGNALDRFEGLASLRRG